MKVLVVLEAVFQRTPDGTVWSSGVFTPSFFTRYLAVFSHVVAAARIQEVANVPPDHHPVADARISFAAIPWYHGLMGYLRARRQVIAALRASLATAEAVVLRVPSPLAGRLHPWLLHHMRPYAVEVVGDPWEVFAPGVVRHPLRPFIRRRLRQELRAHCAGACAAAYVTAHTLQQRYPIAQSIPSFAASSIELPDHAFIHQPRHFADRPVPLRVVCVGTMSQKYKGQDVLLRAVARCRDGGATQVQVCFVGDGRFRSEFEQLTASLGLSGQVRFTGHLAGREAVIAELDAADTCIMPSRTEGLPRALIEAMARGLPCLGTRVGGIPELLEEDALIPTDNHQALAHAIVTKLGDPMWLTASAARNLTVARTYHQDLLHERRTRFYQAVHDATAAWIARR